MTPGAFVTVLVLVTLVLGVLGTYFGYQQYKQQLFQDCDEECMQHAEEIEGRQRKNIKARSTVCPQNVHRGSRWYRSSNTMPASVESIADTMPPRLQINCGIGQGLLTALERVHLTADGTKNDQRGGAEGEYFPLQQMNNEFVGKMAEKALPVRPASIESDADEAVAMNIWSKINNREVGTPRRKPRHKTAQQGVATIRAVTSVTEEGAMRDSDTA
jgi:hypothetical protein